MLKGCPSPLNCFCTFVNRQLGIFTWVCFWSLYTACILTGHVCSHLLEPSYLVVDQPHIPLGPPYNSSHKRTWKMLPDGQGCKPPQERGCVESLMAQGITRGPQGGVGSSTEAETPRPKAWPEETRLSLVSGFGPFRQHLVNSSWGAVKVKAL